jgi:hypothetical protein
MNVGDRLAARQLGDGGAPFQPSFDPPKSNGFLLALAALILAVAVSVGVYRSELSSFVLLLVLLLPVAFTVHRIGRWEHDPTWLPTVLMMGWLVKLVASGGRYFALQVLYSGVGDATGYHNFGTRYAPMWRSLQPPELGTGTEFVQAVTGLIYAPYTPTKLGGFFLFATIAFFGQLLLFSAFRRAFPSPAVKWYAILICFFPNIVYWPSSIGKESLMLLFIGVSAYAAVRLFGGYELRWVATLGVGLVGCAMVRSHMALLIALSVVGAVLLGRGPTSDAARRRKWLVFLVLVVVASAVVRYTIDDFNIDFSAGISETLVEEELDPIFGRVEEQTDRGGSAVEGGAIRSLVDIPEAVIRVVFRPLPPDAHNAQALVNSILEGTLLMLLFLWRAPSIARNLFRRWRHPYILFSLAYTVGFIFGHSAVLNLGIIARQRSQAIPFILALLVELGRRHVSKTSDTDHDVRGFVQT